MEKETQHSEDFLKGFTKGKNPFKTPNNYFDNFADKLSVAKTENQLPKSDGFIVPKNYFKDFKVQQPKSKLIQLMPYVSIAAAFVLGLFVYNQNQQNIIQLEDQNVINYLTYEESIEYDEILNTLKIEDSSTITNDLNGDYVNIEELSKELDVLDF